MRDVCDPLDYNQFLVQVMCGVMGASKGVPDYYEVSGRALVLLLVFCVKSGCF